LSCARICRGGGRAQRRRRRDGEDEGNGGGTKQAGRPATATASGYLKELEEKSLIDRPGVMRGLCIRHLLVGWTWTGGRWVRGCGWIGGARGHGARRAGPGVVVLPVPVDRGPRAGRVGCGGIEIPASGGMMCRPPLPYQLTTARDRWLLVLCPHDGWRLLH